MKLLQIHGLILACLGLLSSYSLSAQAEESPPIAIIVSANPQLTGGLQLSARDLTQIFWRKKQYWQNGTRIHPVNLHAEHPLRLIFSKTVLDSQPNEQADYWNGLYFHGTTPPHSVQSEEAVLRYVSHTKGAIGYVNMCELDDRVKPLLWIYENGISPNKPAYNCSPPEVSR